MNFANATMQANGSDLCQSMTSVMQNDPCACDKIFVHPAHGLQILQAGWNYFIYMAAL